MLVEEEVERIKLPVGMKESTWWTIIKKHYNDFYDYKYGKYINLYSTIQVDCPFHGPMLMTAKEHLNRGCEHGCHESLLSNEEFDCFIEQGLHFTEVYAPYLGPTGRVRKPNTMLETQMFKYKAIQLHQGRYTYAKTKYTRAKDTLVITCAIHGDFTQTPSNHLAGNGCFPCNHTNC